MNDLQKKGYAIGTIRIDGLEPTEDFKKYVEKEKKGELTDNDKKNYLDKRYKIKN